MIIDAHIHIHAPLPEYTMTDHMRERQLAALAHVKLGPDPEEEIGQRVELMDESGIDLSLVLNAQFHPVLGMYRPNEAIHRQVQKFPDRFRAFAGVKFHPTPDLQELEHAVVNLGCIGMKIVPAVAFVYPDDFDLMEPLYRKCIELDVPIMWHIGDSAFPTARPQFASMTRFAEVVAKFPELKHIVAHLGGHCAPEVENLWIEYAATRPNVYIEASYAPRAAMIRNFPLGSRRPVQERYLTEFLYTDNGVSPEVADAWAETKPRQIQIIRQAANTCPERFLFATDAPLAISSKIAMDLYREALGGSGEIWDLVMGENAKRLFKL